MDSVITYYLHTVKLITSNILFPRKMNICETTFSFFLDNKNNEFSTKNLCKNRNRNDSLATDNRSLITHVIAYLFFGKCVKSA